MKALDEAYSQMQQLESLMSERASLEAKYRQESKKLDAEIVMARGRLAMALTMARTATKPTP